MQQTRVAAVIPYYERFLARFPTVSSLQKASEEDLLHAWSGLGYYSRARNLQRAAQTMKTRFPRAYEQIRALPGVGDYTAAAIASIAFNLPHAAVDGNVLRVLSRVLNDSGDIGSSTTRQRLTEAAEDLLDRRHPGEWNQAMMELGATTCLPRDPQCLLCPVADLCEARRLHKQGELPVKTRNSGRARELRTLLIIRRRTAMLFWRRPLTSVKLAGFWELPEPEQAPDAVVGAVLGRFRHSITNHDYSFQVSEATLPSKPKCLDWLSPAEQARSPLSTTARKALLIASAKR